MVRSAVYTFSRASLTRELQASLTRAHWLFQNYAHVFQQYCNSDPGACQLEGLNWHWENVGKAIESPRTTCPESPERLRCYANKCAATPAHMRMAPVRILLECRTGHPMRAGLSSVPWNEQLTWAPSDHSYPDILSKYCSKNNSVIACDVEGLQWHWAHVGKQKGLNVACQQPAGRLRCYAKNYPDILAKYCGGSAARCDLAGLQWHWSNVGEKKEYITTCPETPEHLRCYAQNYPDIFKAYCDSNVNKCDMAGLQWHWTNRGQARGMSAGCSTPERLRCYAQN
mgnify:CR=1 FL=1